MKQFILIIGLFFGSFSFANAQETHEERSEKIQALKIAFITQKLELNADEAQKFWPVYNRYETDLREVIKSSNPNILDKEEQVLNIKKKYQAEFIKVIGSAKTNLLFNSEKEFRGVLMRQLKNRPKGQPQ
jgi:hypothetical protein